MAITDDEAVSAFEYLSKVEGIIPAIESAHALAYARKLAPTLDKDKIIVICLSGRGDKDVAAIARYRGLIYMSRIEQVFMGGKAFIPFITAGDPNLKFTQKLIKEMAEAGADLIEIGIPFSDPIAEGPVIQEASNRALMGGVTVDKIFEMVKELRKECSIPLAFMTYANPVFSYGSERFIKKCKEYGIDGLIIPDVPLKNKMIRPL